MTEDAQIPRFGIIAVKQGFITQTQLQEAMNMQVQEDLDGKPHRLIGSILMDSGYITVQQITDVIKIINDRVLQVNR